MSEVLLVESGRIGEQVAVGAPRSTKPEREHLVGSFSPFTRSARCSGGAEARRQPVRLTRGC